MADKDQLIRERAHDLWEQAGRPHGRSDEFWALAAREVEADETGEDPVPIDAVPGEDDSARTRNADIDRLTPDEATGATMAGGGDRMSEPEAQTRRPL